MRVPLLASEPARVARAAAAELEQRGIPAILQEAALLTPPLCGLEAGELDLLLDHRDLPRARAALEGLEASRPLLAGRPAPGGVTLLCGGPGGGPVATALGRDPRGRPVVVRRIALPCDPGWSELRRLEDAARQLLAERRTDLAPELVAAAATDGAEWHDGADGAAEGAPRAPALELVLRPRAGLWPSLRHAWSRGRTPLQQALLAWRVLRDAILAAGPPGLGALDPDDLLVGPAGLQALDLGLDALLELCGQPRRAPGPLQVEGDDHPWPTGDLCRAAAVLRSLLAGGPGAPLPPEHSRFEELVPALRALGRPDRAALDRLVAGLGG